MTFKDRTMNSELEFRAENDEFWLHLDCRQTREIRLDHTFSIPAREFVTLRCCKLETDLKLRSLIRSFAK